MPQMAPYNWFMLFLLFNMIMIFFFMMNHFILMNTIKFSKKNNKKLIFHFRYFN